MDKIIEGIKSFLSTGNNLTIVIIIAILVLALIFAMIIAAIKKKKVEKKVAEEEALAASEAEAEVNEPLDIETITLSPIVEDIKKEESGAVLVNSAAASEIADETVIMTPVREKKRPVRKSKQPAHVPQEMESSFVEPLPSPDDGKRPGTVQIYKDNGGKFRFRFRSSNMNTVGHSQGYTAKATCKSGIQAVVRVAEHATISDSTKEESVAVIGKATFEIYKDKENKFRFRIIAANASNVLASQGYTSKANCIKGIESIRRIAEYHTIVDDTLQK
ncbi:MAG: YegP family protein [Clostridia bacterium]|nr:YegP family protein [Clostridia bacterium]